MVQINGEYQKAKRACSQQWDKDGGREKLWRCFHWGLASWGKRESKIEEWVLAMEQENM